MEQQSTNQNISIPDNSIPPLVTEEKRENNSGVMKRSHVRKTLERQSRKTVALTLFGVLLLVVILIMYGQTMLINFAILLGGMKGSDIENEQQVMEVFVPAPVLEPVITATNSAVLEVNGTISASSDVQVRLYINEKVADVTNLTEDDTFTFAKVTLKEGINELKAQAVVKQNKSKYSNIIRVIYQKKPPELTVEQPSDGQTISGENTIIVKGTTDQGAKVTVNGSMAIVKDDGSFSQAIVLQNSENKILIVAVDVAGNKTEQEIKVTYSQ